MILKLRTSNVWMALKKHVITLSNNNNISSCSYYAFRVHLNAFAKMSRQDKTRQNIYYLNIEYNFLTCSYKLAKNAGRSMPN